LPIITLRRNGVTCVIQKATATAETAAEIVTGGKCGNLTLRQAQPES
jgi:hypothetical protein